jgi:hypothetical protein
MPRNSRVTAHSRSIGLFTLSALRFITWDWFRWVTAAELALGWHPATLLEAYTWKTIESGQHEPGDPMPRDPGEPHAETTSRTNIAAAITR